MGMIQSVQIQSARGVPEKNFPMMRRTFRPRLSLPRILKISSFSMSCSCSAVERTKEDMIVLMLKRISKVDDGDDDGCGDPFN